LQEKTPDVPGLIKMKIAIVSHLYPTVRTPANGSFIRDFFQQISGSAEAGMLVPTPWAPPGSNRKSLAGQPFLTDGEATRVPYLSLPRRIFPGFIRHNLSRALVSCLEDKKPDLVHLNWLYPDGLAIPSIKRLGLPVVLTIHGSDWYKTYRQHSLKKLQFESFRDVDHVFTVGSKLKKDILDVYPEFEDKFSVVHNFVDFELFRPPAVTKKIQEELGWDTSFKHALCVANLSPEKGVDVLLRAMGSIPQEIKLHLHIIGNRPGTEYARKIQAQAGSNPSVFLHDPVPHEQLPPYFQGCDLFVLPSRKEGFGIALAEAVACGKPVVSTRSGGPEDIVTPENGYLVSVDDPGELAERIEAIIAQGFPCSSEQIRNTVTGRFSARQVISQILDVYQHLLSGR
jgi:glycosyltransferase involved in cell wall biosynthesis